MPQASQEVLGAWPDGDAEAIEFLKTNFALSRGGVYVLLHKGYRPSKREFAALDYLIQEWDYGYDPEQHHESSISPET